MAQDCGLQCSDTNHRGLCSLTPARPCTHSFSAEPGACADTGARCTMTSTAHSLPWAHPAEAPWCLGAGTPQLAFANITPHMTVQGSPPAPSGSQPRAEGHPSATSPSCVNAYLGDFPVQGPGTPDKAAEAHPPHPSPVPWTVDALDAPETAPQFSVAVPSPDAPGTRLALDLLLHDRASEGSQAPRPAPSGFQRFRQRLRAALDSKAFSACIIVLILGNTVTLALNSPSASQQLKDVLEVIELVMLILFTLEMALKMLAFGLVGADPKGYFRDGWNWLDCFIVVLGWITQFANGANLSALRAMRVFRILKGVRQVGGMRILVETLGRSLPALWDVFALMAFFLSLFSIMGVQLFVGVLNRRCYIPTEVGNATLYELDEAQEGRCTAGGSALIFTGWPCNAGTECLEPATFPADGCAPNQTHCPYVEPVLSWDNSLKALLTSTKILSLDDWPTEQEGVQDGLAHIAWMFFWVVIVLGSLFAINLVLAVQCAEFTKAASKEREDRLNRPPRAHATRWDRLRNRVQLWWTTPAIRGPQRQKLFDFVRRREVELFVLAVTLVNVAFLAADYYRAPDALKTTIQWVNFSCTIVFVIEALLKLAGYGLRAYFADPGNDFDFVLVVLSLVELGLSGSSAISAFRAFRLVRVVKVARHFTRLRAIIAALSKSVNEALAVSLLLLIFLSIFAILGMQLYGEQGVAAEEPRFSFETLWQSLYTVFIVITGESWATIMSLTIQDTSWASALYFLAVFVVGNYILVNLFVCILIDALAYYSETHPPDKKPDEAAEKWRVTKLFTERFRGRKGKGPPSEQEEEGCGPGPDPEAEQTGHSARTNDHSAGANDQSSGANRNSGDVSTTLASQHPEDDGSSVSEDRCSPVRGSVMGLQGMTEFYFLEDYRPPPAKPVSEASAHARGSGLRARVRAVVQHRWFEWFILSMILLNAVFLCFQTPWTTSNCVAESCDTWSLTLYTANIVFVVVFTVELVLNLIGLGFREYVGYWAEGCWHAQWGNYIDIGVVLTSLIGLAVPPMKVFRSLRTLRLVSRVERVYVVVVALCKSIPVLGTVVVVLSFIWFLFAVLGVQLLMGRYGACVDTEVGEPMELNEVDCVGGTLRWESPRWDFDNIFVAFVTLTIVALGEGWASIMWQAIDSTGQGM